MPKISTFENPVQHRNFFISFAAKTIRSSTTMITDYFSNRSSVRKFTDKEVSDKLLNSIIERASKAPTTGNMQVYSIIVTREENRRRKLAEAHFNQPAATGAPVLLTICADFNRFTRWCKLSKADPGFDNFLSFTSAMLDATIIAQQIVTIAEMEELGTCYLGTATFNAPKIAELLKLPELVVPVAALAIGYPAEKGEATERLPLQAFCHEEEYPAFTDAEIKDLYRVKDEFEPNKGYVREHSKESIAQVFTDIRYPKQMNEDFSTAFLDYLQKSGFLKNR